MAAQGTVSDTTWNNLLSTTLNTYANTLVDNVFSARPFLWWLREKNQVKVKGGGNRIVQQLENAENGAAKPYAKYDAVIASATEADNEIVTSAEWPWRQYSATISISGLEERQNSGEEELLDLLNIKVKNAEGTLAEDFDEMFIVGEAFSKGSASTRWNGLAELVNNSTSVACGGITPEAANPFWKSYVNNNSGTDKALTLGDMTTAFNTVSRGNDAPDFILTTQTLFEKYEALLQPQQRFTDAKMADGGFQVLLFKTAPVVFDTYVQAKTMYFLNSKYIYLVGHRDAWFSPTPFVKPYDRDARYAQILCQGNLVVSNRERLGKLQNRTA